MITKKRKKKERKKTLIGLDKSGLEAGMLNRVVDVDTANLTRIRVFFLLQNSFHPDSVLFKGQLRIRHFVRESDLVPDNIEPDPQP